MDANPLNYYADFNHFPEYCEKLLKIATKGEGLQPLVFNTTQRVIFDKIVELRARGIPPRLIVLKSRQVGVSTLTEALCFHDCHTHANRSSLVLTHKAPLTKSLFRMTRRFDLNLPDEYRLKKKLDSVHEIHFAENDSRMQVETAGEARGYTAQNIHLSEFAFYQDARDTLKAIMQSAPRSTDSLVLIESTANGVGNAFHSVWLKAMNKLRFADEEKTKKGIEEFSFVTGFVPIFVPWFKHEEYMLAKEQVWFSQKETTMEERRLAKQFGLNMRQLAWRRWCIDTNCDGDEQIFKVEYPSTWREAFLLSGRPIFDSRALTVYGKNVPPEIPQAIWERKAPRTTEISWDDADRKPVIEVVDRGRLRIYREPEERHTYIIGADPSEGDRGSDPSPLEVLDQQTLSQVGEWWGRTPPDHLAEIAVYLAKYYNQGLIINEANNHGINFHTTVIRMDYPNLYYRTVDENSVSGEVTQKPGYMETNKNKHALMNTFRKFSRIRYQQYLKDTRMFQLYSPILIGEMHTAVYVRADERSVTKVQPEPGNHIDTVVAWGLCLIAHRGDETAPLEPLPLEYIESAAFRVAALRERDVEGADAMALDITGMTCEELERLSEIREEERMRREAFGLGDLR